MRLRPGLCAIAVLSLSVSGCTWAEWLSIHRQSSFSPDSAAVFSDAKQRIVVSSTPDEHARFYGSIQPKRILCTEPSPDVAQAVSGSVAATIEAAIKKAEVGGQGSATLALATADSIAQLGERLATIQLLRDKAYRACEAYANGAISATTYTLLMSRHDRTMATLLLGEMATGAFGRRLASVSGNAGASTGSRAEDVKAALEASVKAADELKAADATLLDRKTELEAAEKLPDSDTTKADKVKEGKQKVADAEKERARKLAASQAADGLLRQRNASAIAGGQAGEDIGTITRAGNNTTDRIIDLQRQLFDANEITTLLDACVTATDRLPFDPGATKEVGRISQLSAESRRAKPDEARIQELARGTRLEAEIAKKPSATEIQQLSNKAIGAIAAENPSAQFAQFCNLNLPTILEALKSPRTLPSTALDSQKLTLELEQSKLCREIWQTIHSKDSTKDAVADAKTQWKNICEPLLTKVRGG